MTRRLLVSAAVGALIPLGFAFGFLLAVRPAHLIIAAVLRRNEDNHQTSSRERYVDPPRQAHR